MRKMPRSMRGMVNTNWRWGTSRQTEVAIHSPVDNTRRWWQAGSRACGMAGLAGEGEEPLVAAVRAAEAGEAGGEVAAAVKGLDDGNGCGIERAVSRAVAGFIVGEEVVPRMVDDLPEG